MSKEPPDSDVPADPHAEAERRRRRARVFGDVLPDSTSDDVGDAERDSTDSDEWLRRQKPPHHG